MTSRPMSSKLGPALPMQELGAPKIRRRNRPKRQNSSSIQYIIQYAIDNNHLGAIKSASQDARKRRTNDQWAMECGDLSDLSPQSKRAGSTSPDARVT